MTEIATRNVFTDEGQRTEAGMLFKRLEESMAGKTRKVGPADLLQVTPKFAQFLAGILEQIAEGRTFTIGTLPEELTTTVAAEQLGISRMTLMKAIRDGELRAHKVGTHTRVNTKDVLALRTRRIEHQRHALEELLAVEDEFDIR